MTTVHQVLASSAHALPALQIARLAGVQIEDAYAELVALEGRSAAKVEPCRGEWLWRLVPMAIAERINAELSGPGRRR